MKRTVKDVMTGEETVETLTQAEADIIAQIRADEAAKSAARETAESDLSDVPKWAKALALVVADLHGMTPAQFRTVFKAKYRSL